MLFFMLFSTAPEGNDTKAHKIQQAHKIQKLLALSTTKAHKIQKLKEGIR